MTRRPYNGVVRDGNGRIIPSATVTFNVNDTGLPATIYAAQVGGVALALGQTTSGTDGAFTVWIDDDDYALMALFDVVISKFGYASKTTTIMT